MSEITLTCPACKREAIAVERIGGWTVDCKYNNPWTAFEEDQSLCEYGLMGFHETEQQAIDAWNKQAAEYKPPEPTP